MRVSTFTNVGLEEAQRSSLANFVKIPAIFFCGLSPNPVLGICVKALSHLISLLTCCFHISLYPRVPAGTLLSGFVSHVGGDATDLAMVMGGNVALITLAAWRRRFGLACRIPSHREVHPRFPVWYGLARNEDCCLDRIMYDSTAIGLQRIRTGADSLALSGCIQRALCSYHVWRFGTCTIRHC